MNIPFTCRVVKLQLLKSLHYFIHHHNSIALWNWTAVISSVSLSRCNRADSRLESQFLRCADIMLKLLHGYCKLLVRPTTLPCFWVQSSPNPEEPSPCTVWPVQCRWLDPFSKQVLLSFVPQRPGFEVAT